MKKCSRKDLNEDSNISNKHVKIREELSIANDTLRALTRVLGRVGGSSGCRAQFLSYLTSSLFVGFVAELLSFILAGEKGSGGDTYPLQFYDVFTSPMTES